jgi:hypothetical protein
MITFAIFYMTYMLHSVPIHQESEPFAVDVILKFIFILL